LQIKRTATAADFAKIEAVMLATVRACVDRLEVLDGPEDEDARCLALVELIAAKDLHIEVVAERRRRGLD
jgi:hypothetical protein